MISAELQTGGAEERSTSIPLSTTSLFSELNDDIKILVLSFVSDAPFELHPNIPISNVTHTLPLVCRQFHTFSQSDTLWKSAIQRQITKHERVLWRGAVKKILTDGGDKGEGDDKCKEDNAANLSEMTELELVDRVYETGNYKNFKALYQEVVQKHLRFTAPLFCMGSNLERLGRPYSLHFFEPRYQFMMSEIMSGQSEAVRRGEGPVVGENSDVCFIHATSPLQPMTLAVLVRVLRCGLYPDGRADALMVPIQTVWLEDIGVRPNTGGLHYAQCLRLSRRQPDREAAARYYRERQRRRREQSVANLQSNQEASQPTLWTMIKSSVLAFCFFGVAMGFVIKSLHFIFASRHSTSTGSGESGQSSGGAATAENNYAPSLAIEEL